MTPSFVSHARSDRLLRLLTGHKGETMTNPDHDLSGQPPIDRWRKSSTFDPPVRRAGSQTTQYAECHVSRLKRLPPRQSPAGR